MLESENQRLRSEKHFIEQTLLGQLACSCASNAILYNSLRETANNLSARDIRNDDSKTCFYTGLSKYALFNALFDLLKGYYVSSSLPESVKMDYFFAVLVKLRLNPPLRDLAYRLGVGESQFSAIFHNWLTVMYHNLKQLIVWPDSETLRENLPVAFRKHFINAKCIIDCFEIFIERPLSFDARAATYSNYKKHNTVKVLIAIAPTGAITFISKAWGGRVSDKVITQECGFLDHIEPGDLILADRGFNVSDEVAIRQAKLVLPSFTRGKKQLSKEEVERSRQLAHVRIHVERVIGQLRKKYKILQGPLPITLIKRPSDSEPTIDHILVVTSALVNLCPSVV